MKQLIIGVVMCLPLLGCQEFARDVGNATKNAAEAVGDVGNEVARTVKNTVERNKEE